MAWLSQRERLLEELGQDGRVSDIALSAIAAVPREIFVPAHLAELAWEDSALQLAPGATISAPSMVAAVISALAPAPGLRALELGSGSGYAAAVLAATGMEVVGVELLPELVASSRLAIAAAGYSGRVTLEAGNAMDGWAAGAPYDRVVASAAIAAVPMAWLDQVAPGGILVYPESSHEQWEVLVRLERLDPGWSRQEMGRCKFVHMQR
ncbi:MAG: protein-L-isoaspartate(D-aspartate) O-methyltransferase [Chloroflexota bacterium]|jgi:protein-L-isoaspartate(D-aspartate) O-methyltransferase|nr:protein-L-isoaspartate(D-aspartate) O-methyltransferase [Chloroflexota bacterium]